MSRRISTKKRFPEKDFKYNHLLVSLMINRILKSGKKRLARKILSKAFELVEQKTTQKALYIFEKAIRNVSPKVQLKAKRLGGSTFQVPILLTRFRSTHLAINWIVQFSRKRLGKGGMATKLANELMDAAKGVGTCIKKRDEVHKMAEANKAFLKFNFNKFKSKSKSKSKSKAKSR